MEKIVPGLGKPKLKQRPSYYTENLLSNLSDIAFFPYNVKLMEIVVHNLYTRSVVFG